MWISYLRYDAAVKIIIDQIWNQCESVSKNHKVFSENIYLIYLEIYVKHTYSFVLIIHFQICFEYEPRDSGSRILKYFVYNRHNSAHLRHNLKNAIMKILFIYLHNLASREQLRHSCWFMPTPCCIL